MITVLLSIVFLVLQDFCIDWQVMGVVAIVEIALEAFVLDIIKDRKCKK